MAEIQLVKTVDDLIRLRTIFVSCTDKSGLTSNQDLTSNGDSRPELAALPSIGLLGAIAQLVPEVLFISTGETFATLRGAGLRVVEVSEYTGFPEMKTGLVKSLHPRVHAGILAHRHTPDDDEFMRQHNIRYLDAIIANFYPLDATLRNRDASAELIRQMVDVGGPTMAHSARKGFLGTALVTQPAMYAALLDELRANHGSISLRCRLELARAASKMITEYMLSVDHVFAKLSYEDLLRTYQVV